jgi:hypothetical protein
VQREVFNMESRERRIFDSSLRENIKKGKTEENYSKPWGQQ